MLKHIPFYGSLLRQPLTKNKKTTTGHVLVYGAVEAHDMGSKGCVASNATLGKEVGLSASRVSSLLTDLNAAGWVEVVMDAKNQRKQIIPKVTLAIPSYPPSQEQLPPLAADSYIDNSKENSKTSAGAGTDNEPADVLTLTKDETPPVPPAPPLETTPSVRALYYRVIKKYGLPTWNNNVLKVKIQALENEIGQTDASEYLNWLLDKDYNSFNDEFRPQLTNALDIYTKRVAITQWLKKQKAQGNAPAPKKSAAQLKEQRREEEKARRLMNADFMEDDLARDYLLSVMPAEEVAEWLEKRHERRSQ